MNLGLLVLAILAGLVGYGLRLWVVCFIQVQAFKRKNGCKPAIKWGQRDPVLGLDQFMAFQKNADGRTALEKLNTRYRTDQHTLTLRMMGQPLVMTCEPENVKAVLASKFEDFGLGTRMRAMDRLLGHGIFTADGESWECSRASDRLQRNDPHNAAINTEQALIRPSFTRAQVAANLDCVETHVQRLIQRLPEDGQTVDLQPLFFNFTIDNSTEFLLGRSIDCQTNPDMAHFSESWDYAEACLPGRIRLGKIIGIIDAWKKNEAFEEACDVVHRFVDSYIADSLRESHSPGTCKDSKPSRYNLLSELSSACDNPTQLRSELLNVLLAARDTTAGLLSSIFYFLARHPDVWRELETEVDELQGRVPDYDSLKGMYCLKSIVDETLRLHPPVPVNMRFATRHTTIPRGGGPDGLCPVFVAKGTAVHYSVWATHRLPEIFGDDADAFRPARWRDPSRPLRPGWGYLPFNGGPRVCLGQQRALFEARYVLVRLVQCYARVEARGGVFRENLALTLTHADGVKVALWKRA
ncbi:hypothetical protein PG985_009558 [Apiospora marii]|uniref:uncharacterized protein n=1 Tax=Apiospora marii TaxID=335849 RepID=UPI00312E62C2